MSESSGKSGAPAAAEPASETTPFWEAAERGELQLKTCDDCGKPFHYPRTICPLCGSANTHWQVVDGLGTIFACSVARRVAKPFCIAYVQLDAGPILMSNVVADDLDAVRIGQRVKPVFLRGEDGRTVPMFASVEEK